MARADLNDLVAFLAVARERSFTRAAAKLGVSQSALSHTIRGLEARLGLRLLTRTTRSVSPTEAGERLLVSVGPRFDEIEAELEALSELSDKPAGTIRITAGEHAAKTILWPRLETFLPDYPDIKVEIFVDNGLTDIVAERYDAGVRLGEQVAKDMIAVRIGPDWRLVVVGSPSYFARPPRAEDAAGPHRPSLHQSAAAHLWRTLRLGVREGRPELNVRVDGQLVFNSTAADPQRGARRPRPGLRAGGHGQAAHRHGESWSGCLTTGARPSQAIISITRAAAKPRPHSRCGRCAEI